jgi:Rod binding domain-containing protein
MSDSTINNLNVQAPTPKVPSMKVDSREKLEKSAEEFEGIFMDIVMKSMRETVGESDVSGDSQKVKFFQSMLDTEYSKQLSEQGSVGLKDAIVRQLAPKLPHENPAEKKGIQG